MPTRLVFLGLPGAGKGTQAKLYAAENTLAHISTGEMLRAAVAGGSTLGQRVKAIMDEGQLVPDELMVELIAVRVQADDCRNGYVLDGYPRTIPQAKALEESLNASGEELTAVVYFELTEAEVRKRLSARRGLEGRSDDSDEVQNERFRVYQEQTAPLVEYYREKNQLITVDALGSIEEVQARLSKALAS